VPSYYYCGYNRPSPHILNHCAYIYPTQEEEIATAQALSQLSGESAGDMGDRTPSPTSWADQYKLSDELVKDLSNKVMLADDHVNAFAKLLRGQFPQFTPIQEVALGALAGLSGVASFESVRSAPSVQVHHIAEPNHYLVSCLTVDDNYLPRVCVFDTALSVLKPSMKKQLIALYGDHASLDGELVVHMMRAQVQDGAVDCGIFAMAYAFEFYSAMSGTGDFSVDSLEHLSFAQPKMRKHLLKCFQDGQVTAFPRAKKAAERRMSSKLIRVTM
jgi:hypothetical protein